MSIIDVVRSDRSFRLLRWLETLQLHNFHQTRQKLADAEEAAMVVTEKESTSDDQTKPVIDED